MIMINGKNCARSRLNSKIIRFYVIFIQVISLIKDKMVPAWLSKSKEKNNEFEYTCTLLIIADIWTS